MLHVIQEGHLHTQLPLQTCASAVRTVMTLTKLVAKISEVSPANIWPQAVELRRLLDQVELMTSEGPFDQDVDNTVHSTILAYTRTRREVREYFDETGGPNTFDLISASNHHFAITIPPKDLFVDYVLFENTTQYLDLALKLSKNTTLAPEKLAGEVTNYLTYITYSGFFDRAFDFLHGVLSLFQKRLTPSFFNQAKAKQAIDKLSLKIKKDIGKALISDDIFSALRFPFSLIAKNGKIHLILSIPITQGSGTPTYQLLKRDYFFTQDAQTYSFTINPHSDIIATGQENTAYLMQTSDLQKCFRHQNKHFCPTQPQAGNLHNSCLASMYVFDPKSILQHCPISVTKIMSSAYIHLHNNKYQVVAQTPTVLSYSCHDKTDHYSLTPNVVYEVTLTKDCDRIFSPHFSAAFDITGPPKSTSKRPFDTEALTALTFNPFTSDLQGSFQHILSKPLQALHTTRPWHVDSDEVVTIILGTLSTSALLMTVALIRFCIRATLSRNNENSRPFWKHSHSPSPIPPYVP